MVPNHLYVQYLIIDASVPHLSLHNCITVSNNNSTTVLYNHCNTVSLYFTLHYHITITSLNFFTIDCISYFFIPHCIMI